MSFFFPSDTECLGKVLGQERLETRQHVLHVCTHEQWHAKVQCLAASRDQSQQKRHGVAIAILHFSISLKLRKNPIPCSLGGGISNSVLKMKKKETIVALSLYCFYSFFVLYTVCPCNCFLGHHCATANECILPSNFTH